jgi:PAS domain-containing protein
MLPEKLFSHLFHASSIGYCLLAPTEGLEILEVNDAFLAGVHRSRAEVQGKRLFDAFPDNPADPYSAVNALAQSISTAIETGKSQVMEAQHYPIEIHRDGRRWFEDRV